MISDHRFTGLRQWGINPTGDKPCQFIIDDDEGRRCGKPLNQHARQCEGTLIIKGESFPCDNVAPHDGWAHGNKDAEAIWQ